MRDKTIGQAPPRDPARNPQLEAAILDSFEDPQGWTVYADWLSGQGDPWGERIALALSQTEAEVAKYDAANREALLGKRFANLIAAPDIDEVAAFEWKHGFVVSARISIPDAEWEGTEPYTVLRELLRSPASRFLRSLTLGLLEFDGESEDFSKALKAIGAMGSLPALENLFVGDFEYPDEAEISWVNVGDVEPALLAAPNLRTLHLRGAGTEFGKALEHAKLERLTIESGGLPAAAVEAIGKCRLPELCYMEVWFGSSEFGADGNIRLLRPLFSGDGVPKLEHLGLMNSEFEDEIASELATSSLLGQLERVDLSMGTLRDDGGKAILDHAGRFAHLQRLELDHNYLSDAMAEALERALAGIVHIGERREPFILDESPHYFTEVGE
ncbi:MAG: molybdenum metabolism regulator [Deltaproteobacteria bacterium]|nr:molybdenum metabolism regulator [Deltaproteobacteria bacterium]